jgi:hypothetical protein
MTRYKPTFTASPAAPAWAGAPRTVSWVRRAAAWALRAAGAALDRLAQRLETAAPRHEPLPPLDVEFHACAGAPEGALYVDGQFVGWLPGVQRL